MAVKRIRCPKCSHEQRMAHECEACGVIFSRFKRAQERVQEEESARTADREKRTRRVWSMVQTLVLVLLTAGGTYYFVKPDVTPQPQQKTPVAVKVVEPQTVAESIRPEPPSVRPQAVIEPTGPMTIEEARMATVSIETPWGSGSGFFLSNNYVVTNRHVVQMDETVVTEFRRKVDKTRELVDLEKKKVRDLRARMRQTPKGPTYSQMKIIVEEGERGLNTILPQLEEAEKRLARLEEPLRATDIKIILADGSSYVANYLLISEKSDLALMALYINDAKYLRRAPANYQIQQGDKVFTIGSPVGLRNTVTAGVFSGYRQDPKDGSLFLQTDAPINPGNSGGPLIDENGYVHGVNTMILRDTEGIGFAIPIETVFKEFGSTLY